MIHTWAWRIVSDKAKRDVEDLCYIWINDTLAQMHDEGTYMYM